MPAIHIITDVNSGTLSKYNQDLSSPPGQLHDPSVYLFLVPQP